MPFRLLKSFHKIQQRLVRELEKKFSGKDVVLIANRRIMRPVTTGRSNDRPRSRTLTAVWSALAWCICSGPAFCMLGLLQAASALYQCFDSLRSKCVLTALKPPHCAPSLHCILVDAIQGAHGR